ncbi:MAG: peptidoglycan DD-metalloendopeptidase family protein [Nitrospiraceae bacterium]|nr:MAG: peptidoglycan DD-metalloendopeptidase family protein [Nitrospiraceae bacterium]
MDIKKSKTLHQILSVVTILITVFYFSLFSSYFSPVHSASPKKKLSVIEKKLKKKKRRVKEAIKKEKSILSRLERINKNIKTAEKELKKYDRQISDTQSRIMNLSKDITLLTDKMDLSKKYLADRARDIYTQRYVDNALILITADDYQDLITKSKYLSLLAYHDSKIIKKYRKDINEINFKKQSMEVLQNKLELNKKIARDKKSELETDRIKKDKLLATVRSKRNLYERTIKELEESSKKLREMMKRLEEQQIPESVTGKGFIASRGHLPWPVDGKVLIPYGKYKDPKFNITVFKNGIEIKAENREKPKAVAGGRVVYSDWFKGYGLLLIINHGNGYHSLYGNLSETFHKTGDIINKGTVLGVTGRSGLLNVPTLYFEIRHKGQPVNPMKWLKRRSRAKKN